MFTSKTFFAPPKILLSMSGLVLFLLAWEALWRMDLLGGLILPAPSHIPMVAITEFRGGNWSSKLSSSLQHYIPGVLLGTVFGILLGIANGVFPPSKEILEWIIRLLRPIPPLAWIPFAIVWFGNSHLAASFMIGIGVFWLNYFATLSAVLAVDSSYLELAEAYGHSTLSKKVTKVVVPAAIPGIFSGVRSGLGQGWMLLIAAELFGVPGIGQRMIEASGLLATDIVVVYMLTIAMVYSATDWLFILIETKVLRWQRY